MLKNILIVIGVVLIAFGLYNAFVPQEVLDVGPLEVSAKEGLSSQSLVMMGLGLVAIIAGVYLGKK